MKTVYFRLKAARITSTSDGMPKGREGICYAILPQKRPPSVTRGTILDFSSFCPAAESRHTVQSPCIVPQEERVGDNLPSPRVRRAFWTADLWASAAVVMFAALAAIGVFLT